MTITPIMQYIQDRILEAVHGCSLEEAKVKETFGLKIYPSMIGGQAPDESYISKSVVSMREIPDNKYLLEYSKYTYSFFLCEKEHTKGERYTRRIEVKEIILHPISLSRILTCLETKGIFRYGSGVIEKYDGDKAKRADFCSRTIHNTDKTDCNLFDQSKETITAIALLLGWKDE